MIEQLDKDELLALLHKRCNKCGEVKYLGEFGKHSRSFGGTRPYCKKCQKAYRKYLRNRNPLRFSAKSQRRRSLKSGASGTHSADQVKARFDYYGNKCIYCGSVDKLEVEHRIPLSRGGTNWPANLAPACKSCNCSKGTKTETEFKRLLEETR